MTTSPSANGLDPQALAQRLLAALRPILFDSRLTVSPRRMGQIAVEAASSFLSYQGTPEGDVAAHGLGRRLAHDGLGHASILAIVESLHEAALEPSEAPAVGRPTARYCSRLLAGYMAAREEHLLAEQERTRRALDRARDQAAS